MNKTNNYDLNLLAIFRLLMEIGSVTKVAAKVGISQSALSHALNKLRNQFDDPLFYKTAHGMEPSIKAKELYQSIKEPLESLTLALQLNQEFNPKTSQHRFVLGTSDYFEKLMLPQIIQYCAKHAPEVKFSCVNCDEQELTQELKQIDLIFGRFKTPPDNLYKQTLWQDCFVTLVNKKHPRIKNGQLNLQQFTNEKHVLISPTGTGTSIVDRELTKQGLKRDIALSSRLFSTPIEIIENSEMITTVPERLAKHMVNTDKVNILDAPITLPTFETNMIWGPIKHTEPAHQWLRKTMMLIAKHP